MEGINAWLAVDAVLGSRFRAGGRLEHRPRFSAWYIIDPVWGDSMGRCSHLAISVKRYEGPPIPRQKLRRAVEP
jgi:hypothetical protein